MKYIHAFACAAACVLATGARAEAPADSAAIAAQDRVVRTMSVPASDLDLSQQAGRRVLDGRLRRAAARVCAEARHPQGRPDWDQIYCVNRALRGARLEAASLPATQQAAAGGGQRAGR